jgi:hypothetical protein
MQTFANWLNEVKDYFQGGSFGPINGKYYSVPKTVQCAEKSVLQTPVNIKRLIADLFSSDVGTDEPVGSMDWQARASQADLSKPILVIRTSSGIYVGDGMHRLWKAYKAGQRLIRAYVVEEKDLPEEAVV